MKDCTLLRRFNPKTANVGDVICSCDGEDFRTFVAGPDVNGEFVAKNKAGELRLCTNKFDAWKVAPLCWVEGKPVYKGDVLYFLDEARTASHITTDREGDVFLYFNDGSNCWISGPSSKLYSGMPTCTWTPPKVKREGWICVAKCTHSSYGGNILADRIARNADIFECEQSANEWAKYCGDVVATVRIEWEESAGAKGGAT